MKKIFFPLACLLLILSSCKKSVSGGTLTAYINGTMETFNTNAVAELTSGGGAYKLAIGGSAGDPASTDQIYLAITGVNNIVPGNYSAVSASGDVAVMAYQKPGNIGYSADDHFNNPVKITISSISGSNVQGSFTGNLILVLGASSDSTKTITNGTFNVSLQ